MGKQCFKSAHFITGKYYSPAVICGDTVFFSSMGPMDPKTSKITSLDFEDQMRQVLDNIRLLLEEMGLSLAHVVKVNWYMPDLRHLAKGNELYAQYFGEDPPARTTIQVAGLPTGVQVELEVVATLHLGQA